MNVNKAELPWWAPEREFNLNVGRKLLAATLFGSIGTLLPWWELDASTDPTAHWIDMGLGSLKYGLMVLWLFLMICAVVAIMTQRNIPSVICIIDALILVVITFSLALWSERRAVKSFTGTYSDLTYVTYPWWGLFLYAIGSISGLLTVANAGFQYRKRARSQRRAVASSSNS